jgi:hypothetical protein
MNLPVDFEQKVKLPPAVNGRSYPYQISARDLMQDFRYAALQVDDTEVSGLSLEETINEDGSRSVKLAGEATGVSNINHPFQIEVFGGQWMCNPGAVFDVNNNTYFVTNYLSSDKNEVTFFLKITRNQSTRAITAAQIILNEDGYQGIETTSTHQYTALGLVQGPFDTPYIEQYIFQDIYANEELVVVNGEFRLQGYQMLNRNNYAPPA